MQNTHKVLFMLGLSNGETITEEKGEYTTIPEELSPWRRALAYIQRSGVAITSLSLYTPDGKRWNLPSMGKSPKFHAFHTAEKPVGFNFFRQVAADVNQETGGLSDVEQYAVIEAQYHDGAKIQMWVHNETHVAWTLRV